MSASVEPLACVEVVITADDADWLLEFTRTLVESRLVACGHNIAPIRAIYRWEGKVYDETQARVGLHTCANRVSEIIARADRDHPDRVPCVIAVPVVDGQPEYLQWIRDETAQPAGPP
jgi:periplasmic divalent cation tolerance protein